MRDEWRRRAWLSAAFLAILVVYALALHVPPMDVDGAEYAHIAREMLVSHGWLVIHNRGHAYLDKPPLTFWLVALSYAAFGVSAAASKLPSIVAAIVGWVSVGRLARLDFGRRAGWLAALLFASCQALFLITNDCRTDTVLLGAVAFTLWQARAYGKTGSWRALALTGVGTGLALLAKGPIGAAVPAFAVVSEIALRREWHRFRSWAPLWVAAIAGVLLVPMLVGLYRQFGTRGPTFFFWTQSFGRITGSSRWHDRTGPLFLAHTLLWAFLPWTPILLAALYREGRALVRSRFRPTEPGVGFALGGLVLTYLALSMSRYKLPHYIFVALPFAAVVSARFLDGFVDTASARARAVLVGVQAAVVVALAALAGWLTTVVFPLRAVAVGVVAVACFAAAFAVVLRVRRPVLRIVVPSLLATLGGNVILAGSFYPHLLRYQSGSTAVHVAEARGIPLGEIGCFHRCPFSLEFGVGPSFFVVHRPQQLLARLQKGPVWLYTDPWGAKRLGRMPVVLGDRIRLADYPVSRLSVHFLDPATRPRTLRTRYLVEVRAAAPTPSPGPGPTSSPSPRGSP